MAHKLPPRKQHVVLKGPRIESLVHDQVVDTVVGGSRSVGPEGTSNHTNLAGALATEKVN